MTSEIVTSTEIQAAVDAHKALKKAAASAWHHYKQAAHAEWDAAARIQMLKARLATQWDDAARILQSDAR